MMLLKSCFVLILFSTSSLLTAYANTEDAVAKGKLSYDFYCYQCHGYAGDSKTLASTYLDPKPRDFTLSQPESLSIETMISAITDGRDGTAMVSFSNVLSHDEIKNVVTYIRQSFMTDNKPDYVYHTEANGWKDHIRYKVAFPFASGELPLDTPWEKLNEEQQLGKKLFMQSCISCHDRAVVNVEGPVWELRPLSYPRKHYDHKSPLDSISGASPYQVHELEPDISSLNEQQRRGATLFQQNCAFCHAADGTGKNWIGRFMEPPARDLTDNNLTQIPDEQLLQTIRNGLKDTSMPAWINVLDDDQIIDIIKYLKRQQNDE